MSKSLWGLKLHKNDTHEQRGRDGPYEKTHKVSVSCWLAGRHVRHDETKGNDEATAGGVRGWDGSSTCAGLACLVSMY